MRLLKRVLLVFLVLFLVAGGYGYYKLKEVGLIPRKIYETVPPDIPDYQRPAVLVLSKANGYIHVDAIPAGQAMLRRIADEHGWDIFLTDNAASHNSRDLAKFSVVIWNNVSGDVLTSEQRAAMKDWIEAGGGWVGLHASGGDFSYDWDWYVNTLIGAQFVGHTMNPQFQDADVLVAAPASAVTSHLPARWTVPNEEWYAFDSNVRDKGYEILLTLDEDSYITKGESFRGQDSMPGEHPIAWRHQLGQGRVLYSAIGHQGATYDIPQFQQLIANAIAWAGLLPGPLPLPFRDHHE
jgi:type 1 glutamine amidotransferase